MKLPEVNNLISLADALRDRARFKEAIGVYNKALRKAERARDTECVYYCTRSLGDMYRMTGRFSDAAKIYAEAVAVASGMHAPGKAADARVGLSLSLRAQGMWRRALRLIRASKKQYIDRGDRQGTAFAVWAEAGTLRIKGDIPGSLKLFRESFHLFKRLNDSQGVGYCLCGLGGASRVAGRPKASLKYYLTANRLFTDMRDTFGRAYSFCGIANALRMVHDYEGAFSAFSKATRLYRSIGDRVSYAYTLWGLATAMKMMGRYHRARDCMAKAMGYFRETNDPRGLIYCRLGLGEISSLTGDTRGAHRHLMAAQTALEKFGFRVEQCHAQTLSRIIEGKRCGTPAKKPLIGKRKNAATNVSDDCYRRIGVNLRFRSLPLNLP